MLKTKYTVPFTTNYSDAPLIKLRQGDLEFYALVDTGSEQTLIDSHFGGDMSDVQDGQKEDITIVGYSGPHTEGSHPIAKIKCMVIGNAEEYPVTITAELSDLSPVQGCFDRRTGGEVIMPMIIGSDTLIKNEAIIDFAQKSFSFYDKINEEKPV